LLSLLVGTLAAVALTRIDFPGRAFLEAFFLSPLILPNLVIAVALTLGISTVALDAQAGAGAVVLQAHLCVHVVVAGERLASFDVSLDVCHCAIFNEPFRLCRINLNKVVVNALIE
jgi:putative spermidine/putrescine transport system permease protein